jgi:hypothetical protein
LSPYKSGKEAVINENMLKMNMKKQFCFQQTSSILFGVVILGLVFDRASAQKNVKITLSRAMNLTETIRTLSSQRRCIVATEIREQSSLNKTIPAGSYTERSLYTGIKERVRAESWLSETKYLLFVYREPIRLPAVATDKSIEKKENELNTLAKTVESLSSQQTDQLLQKGQYLPLDQLSDSVQGNLLNFVSKQGVRINNVPVANLASSDFSIGLGMEVKMYIREQNGTFHEVTLGSTIRKGQ